MARKIANRPAKRANRPNPRAERNDFIDHAPEFLTGKKKRKFHNDNTPQQTTEHKAKKIEIIPRNLAQEKYLEALEDESKTVVIGMGPSGTGKSWMSLNSAAEKLQSGAVKKLILVRPVVSADGSNLGALPGDILSKLGPFLGELLSLLKDIYGVRGLKKLLEDEIIEVIPIALIRGRSFRDSIIILEEAQNVEEHCLKLILTRIGEGTRCFINGDVKQADKGFMVHNGLKDFVKRLTSVGGSCHFAVCNFSKCDIERHEVVSETLRIYGEED